MSTFDAVHGHAAEPRGVLVRAEGEDVPAQPRVAQRRARSGWPSRSSSQTPGGTSIQRRSSGSGGEQLVEPGFRRVDLLFVRQALGGAPHEQHHAQGDDERHHAQPGDQQARLGQAAHRASRHRREPPRAPARRSGSAPRDHHCGQRHDGADRQVDAAGDDDRGSCPGRPAPRWSSGGRWFPGCGRSGSFPDRTPRTGDRRRATPAKVPAR